ncbi:MAG TPA: helix-turn-helix transcriptional regulator, partial [Bacteroidales bacterium]|nr:helix-turn-helix transcriptional regulator [Bacteroidales bacterium]
SDKEIAAKSGVPVSTIYKLVKSTDIKVSTLLKLAGVLDAPLQFFFNVENSELVTELNVLLQEERSKVSFLENVLETLGQQFDFMIQILKELEKQDSDKTETIFYTQLLPVDTKIIPLSSFFYIYQKMIKSANQLPGKEEMYLKYAEKFLNIVEVRKIIKENPLFIPGRIKDVFTEELDNKAVDEYIDVRKLWKSI